MVVIKRIAFFIIFPFSFEKRISILANLLCTFSGQR